MMATEYLRLHEEVRFFIDGGWVFCSTVDKANNQPVKLNSSASYLWYLFALNMKISDVEAKYIARYGIDQETASHAIAKFLEVVRVNGWGDVASERPDNESRCVIL